MLCNNVCVFVFVIVFIEFSLADTFYKNVSIHKTDLHFFDVPEYEIIHWPELRKSKKNTAHTRLGPTKNSRIIVDSSPTLLTSTIKPNKISSKPITTSKPIATTKLAKVTPRPLKATTPPSQVKPTKYSSLSTTSNKIGSTLLNKITQTSTAKPQGSAKPIRTSVRPNQISLKPTLPKVTTKPNSSTTKPNKGSLHRITVQPNNVTPKPVQSVTVNRVTVKPLETTTKKKKKDKQESSTPCNCNLGQCLCCTGPLLDILQQKACLKVYYIPEDFAFEYSLLLNNRVMYQNKFSGKNPRPACVRIPGISSLRMCAKFSNIYFVGRNMHMCMGLEAKWDYIEIFSIPFDCIRMGAQGFAVVKPEEGGALPGGLDSIIDAGGDDIEDYDENVVRTLRLRWSR